MTYDFPRKYCGDDTFSCSKCILYPSCDVDRIMPILKDNCSDCLLKNTCTMICPIVREKMIRKD